MQIIEIRNAVAAQSIQTIMESSGLNEHPLISQPKRQIENRWKSHFFEAGSLEAVSMDLSEEERIRPSATRAEQSSIMMRMMLMLSQMMRVQKSHLLPSTLCFTQRFLNLGLFFMSRREAYISMRKKMKASSVSVQMQQRGSASQKPMKRAMIRSMLSRMTRGPILSMLVNMAMFSDQMQNQSISPDTQMGVIIGPPYATNKDKGQLFIIWVIQRGAQYSSVSTVLASVLKEKEAKDIIFNTCFVKYGRNICLDIFQAYQGQKTYILILIFTSSIRIQLTKSQKIPTQTQKPNTLVLATKFLGQSISLGDTSKQYNQ